MRLLPLLLAGGAALAVVAALAFLVRDEPGSDRSRFAPTFVAICSAADEARSGDVRAAQRIFLDRAHGPLHQLAGDAERPEAARLLEAKNRVERFDGGGGDRLAPALGQLADATGAAIRSTGADDPRPCPA